MKTEEQGLRERKCFKGKSLGGRQLFRYLRRSYAGDIAQLIDDEYILFSYRGRSLTPWFDMLE